MRCKAIKTLLLAALVAVGAVTGAVAVPLGVDFSAPADVFAKEEVGSDINVVGWTFAVDKTFAIDGLGYFDLNGSATSTSLKESHDVALYSALTGALLASATVSSADELAGQAPFRFHTIDSVALQAGQSYVLAATVGNDPYTADLGTGFTGLLWNPNLTFLNDVFDSSTQSLPLSWTSLESAGVTGGFGPNLRPVPEPGTMLLLGTGLAGLFVARRRARG